MTKILTEPKNYQNTPKTQKMTKISPRNLKNDQNAPNNLKIIKIPPKPKNDQNTPKTQKKDQNTLET